MGGNVVNTLKRSPVVLAPMAGVTDQPFRAAALSFGPLLTYSEMIASRELLRSRGKELRRLVGEGAPGLKGVQLAGYDPAALAEAARIAEGEGADAIDINFGCPAKFVVGFACGSALMRDPDQVERLVAAAAAAVQVPVTAKMRLGWDAQSLNAPEVAKRAEAAGAAMITVHGRTRAQFYKGQADWTAIAAVKAAVQVPVVANGDIKTHADAVAALKASGADAVMIGRGALGAPWRLQAIAKALEGLPAAPSPRIAQVIAIALEQARASAALYGERNGIRMVRKHLSAYCTNLGVPAAERLAILSAETLQDLDVAFEPAVRALEPNLLEVAA